MVFWHPIYLTGSDTIQRRFALFMDRICHLIDYLVAAIAPERPDDNERLLDQSVAHLCLPQSDQSYTLV